MNITTASIGLRQTLLQHRTKLLLRHDGVDLDQRVPLGVKARVAVGEIEETHLRHRHPPEVERSPHPKERLINGFGYADMVAGSR